MGMSANQPHFVTCRCLYCENGIEFDARDFEKGETRTAECPHCGLETIISVPEQQVPPVVQPSLAADDTREVNESRAAIPSDVRREVWRRDGGKCVKCGSRKNLEYDHIIPVSKGGSNTARNIELLCEKHNRSKRDSVQ